MRTILLTGLAVTLISCGTKMSLPAKYRLKYATYGMFTNTIELNKDSSVVKTFRGDLMNNNSFGTWKMRHDTLILKFDSVKHPTNRYLGDEYYIVKRKKLFQTITETQLKMLRKQFSFSDSLSPPTQEKFQEMIRQQQTMIDFKGTMRENYYVKID